MKFALVVLSTMFSLNVFASNPEFSAFTSKNVLYVTLLGDCNHYGAQLEVAGICHEDRLTANYVKTCPAELMVVKTEMGCPNADLKPKVLVVDLKEAKVAKEATELELSYGGHKVNVQINK